MGSGKTTTGEILAEKLDYIFMDLDRIIELDEGKSIDEIFKSCGEDYFRDIESKVIRKIYLNNRCVFACGGGVILRGENMRIIGKNSRVVYLEISPREAVNRLTGTSDRPLLQSKNNFENIAELMKSRSSLYKKYSDIIINNEGDSVDHAASEILKKIAE